jgi:hypothetical protein
MVIGAVDTQSSFRRHSEKLLRPPSQEDDKWVTNEIVLVEAPGPA